MERGEAPSLQSAVGSMNLLNVNNVQPNIAKCVHYDSASLLSLCSEQVCLEPALDHALESCLDSQQGSNTGDSTLQSWHWLLLTAGSPCHILFIFNLLDKMV